MEYYDCIHGPCEIAEPVLLDLLETQAVRRLAGVLVSGISGLIGLSSRTTRLEHSLGAMLLVRRLGATLEEQIAALLHDVSHTAFSHVTDYLFGMHTGESYHEVHKEAFMARSDLPAALARHGYRWQDFLDESAYRLLEQPSPALCADRLDYFFRDSLAMGLAAAADIRFVLDHLTVHDGRIAVDDRQAARFLGYTFIAADDASWSNLTEVGLYELTAQALRAGLEAGIITEADLWTTDEAVWHKLCHSAGPGLKRQLALIAPSTRFIVDEDRPAFRIRMRIRAIDPDTLEGGTLQPLSAVDPEFARYRAAYLQRKQREWPIRVET